MFHSIYDWQVESNDQLAVYFKDNTTATTGWVNAGSDNESTGSPNWTTWDLLGIWHDPSNPVGPKYDVVYSVLASDLARMANSNRFTIGIDPDCHYYLTGITIEVTSVPEPTTLLLLGTGLGVMGLAAWRRRK